MSVLSKLIITKMDIWNSPCFLCAREDDGKIIEIRFQPLVQQTILNNIYLAQVESVSENIQAAFLRLDNDGRKGYLPLSEQSFAIYGPGRKRTGPLRPGDELLVQVSREAMKSKLPALTTKLSFTGKYLVFTTGDKRIGYSGKLHVADKARLEKWVQEIFKEQEKPSFGIIVRTNAAQAEKDEFIREFRYLEQLCGKVALKGRNRTVYSLVHSAEPFYLNQVRDIYTDELTEIVTDVPEAYGEIREYLSMVSPGESGKLRLYEDKLLPLHKLYRIQGALDEIMSAKVWLKSGGFLMIEQTEAFVSIDVNTGKYTGKKKMEETFRKINLEAAREIARQVRLRDLSGIILIDFINMADPDHVDELFHVLKNHLKKDSVKCKAVDITPLGILEMTRKKVRRPVIDELRRLKEEKKILQRINENRR